jgi:hypothetical protein
MATARRYGSMMAKGFSPIFVPILGSMIQCRKLESFKRSLGKQGLLVEAGSLAPLLANMQSLSDDWRQSVGEHGGLMFYVDNC